MAGSVAGPAPSWRRVAPVIGVALPVLAIDQAVKAAVRSRIEPGERIEVLPFLDLVHVHNPGIAFGAFADRGPIVVFATIVVAAVLFVMLFRLPGAGAGTRMAIGAIAGGALGNLVDRVRLGYVTDYVQLPSWPAFNVADTAITAGVAIVIVAQWREAAGPEDEDAGDDGAEAGPHDEEAGPGATRG